VKKRLDEKNSDLKKILEELLDDILAPDTSNGTGCDNMTTILLIFKPELFA